MAEDTKIEWCDHTWSPWEGCQKVGPGCDHCYAEARNQRFAKGANWGPGAPRRRTADWTKPLLWNRKAAKEGRRFRVFPSLCDPFDNAVPQLWRTALFAMIHDTPHLDWLLLTKRIGNAAAMLKSDPPEGIDMAGLPNLWLGATVVNQEEANRDIVKLLHTPARVRFLSIEPMLGPINLEQACDIAEQQVCDGTWSTMAEPLRCAAALRRGSVALLDWVIAGGESGPQARPAHPDWFRALRDECQEACVPFLFKQHGEWLAINQQDEAFTDRLYRSNRQAALHEDQGAIDEVYGRTCTVPYGVVHHDGAYIEPLAPMAFGVGTGAITTFKVGRKAAGRLLDGAKHNGFPRVGAL